VKYESLIYVEPCIRCRKRRRCEKYRKLVKELERAIEEALTMNLQPIEIYINLGCQETETNYIK